MCSVVTLGCGKSDFLGARTSQELKDQNEKPQSGRRLIEQEKHQEKKKTLSPRVNTRMLTGGKKETLYTELRKHTR